MPTNVIKIVRVLKLETKYVNGDKTLVPRLRCEREQKLENYDTNYDACGQKYYMAREW